jgi:hypothetical protein
MRSAPIGAFTQGYCTDAGGNTNPQFAARGNAPVRSVAPPISFRLVAPTATREAEITTMENPAVPEITVPVAEIDTGAEIDILDLMRLETYRYYQFQMQE